MDQQPLAPQAPSFRDRVNDLYQKYQDQPSETKGLVDAIFTDFRQLIRENLDHGQILPLQSTPESQLPPAGEPDSTEYLNDLQERPARGVIEAELERLIRENQRQSNLLDAIFDADPGGLAVLVGPDLRFSYVNPSYRYLTPDPVLDPIGKPYHLVWPKRSRFSHRDRFQEVRNTGKPFLSTGVEHSFPDRSTRIFTVQARRIEWEHQPAVFVILWDTTELNRTEAALRASEARERAKVAELEALVEAVPALVWVSHDPESRVITGNSFSSEFLRMRAGDNLSKSAAETEITSHYRMLQGGREIAADQLPVQRAAKGQVIRDYEFDVVFDDGATRHLFGNAAPLYDEHGAPCGAVSAFIDITDRKKMEIALLDSEQRYRDLIRYAPAGIYELDFHQHKFISVNDVMCELSGYSRDELMQMNPFDLLDPEGKERFRQRIQQWLSGEKPRENVAYRVKTKSGRIIDVVLNVNFVSDDQGRPVGATVIGFDVSDRLHPEDETRSKVVRIELQRRLLDQREQERLKIARDLHDGPLQDLTAATFTLQTLAEDCQDPELVEVYETVKSNLQDAINNLRAFAQELRPPILAKFGLVKAIQAHLEGFREKHPELIIQFEAGQVEEPLPEVQRVAVFRAYQESLANIVKHARASQVSLYFRMDERQASLEIRDNGVGFQMPDDWLALVRGGHLGLVGMRERVEAVGGWLQITAQPGKGTSLRVAMPILGVNPGDSPSRLDQEPL